MCVVCVRVVWCSVSGSATTDYSPHEVESTYPLHLRNDSARCDVTVVFCECMSAVSVYSVVCVCECK